MEMTIKIFGLFLAIMTCFLVTISSGGFVDDWIEPSWSTPSWSTNNPFGTSDWDQPGWFGVEYEPVNISALFGIEPFKWTPDAFNWTANEIPVVIPDTLPPKGDLTVGSKSDLINSMKATKPGFPSSSGYTMASKYDLLNQYKKY
jgi:hypothetical protein